jgi:hypothetical protein
METAVSTCFSPPVITLFYEVTSVQRLHTTNWLFKLPFFRFRQTYLVLVLLYKVVYSNFVFEKVLNMKVKKCGKMKCSQKMAFSMCRISFVFCPF